MSSNLAGTIYLIFIFKFLILFSLKNSRNNKNPFINKLGLGIDNNGSSAPLPKKI
ncbi:hypothetical protein [Methanobrevibacter cuticularis]|uniref:hypothetical protein n=1 Tax=Methanobrevibacter cuticularis TaxID=47311 RepID=UPI0012EE8991|nr:hypothetical protein [Methanobrevibacter cuticularis]